MGFQGILILTIKEPCNFFLQNQLEVFTDVGQKHGAPLFLFHPLLFDPQVSEVIQPETNGCRLLCGHEHFVFGVINSKWEKGQRNSLSTLIVSMSVFNPLTPRSNL